MLQNAISQVKLAANGWRNLTFKNDRIESLYESRLAICQRCEHKTSKTCGLCGCPLAAKLRAENATCPDHRW